MRSELSAAPRRSSKAWDELSEESQRRSYARRWSLEARQVGCDRGGLAILRSVDFSVRPGEALQIFGRNGSGKSSLLNMLAGLTPLASGSVHWRSDSDATTEQGARLIVDPANRGAKAPSRDLVYVSHGVPAKSSLSILENLNYWQALYGKDQPAALQALCEVGLSSMIDRPVQKCSAGQRRRLDLARCALAERPIWLMDEPYAALDKDGKSLLIALIVSHLKRGGIALIAAHERLPLASAELKLA